MQQPIVEQTITITPPSADKPGYLKRRKQSMEINARIVAGDPKAIDEMVTFVLTNATVVVPAGVDAREALMELSEAQFAQIFNRAAVDPTNSA